MNHDDIAGKQKLAEGLHGLLASRRDNFLIDAATLGDLAPAAGAVGLGTVAPMRLAASSRVVSAASLRLVLDWAQNSWPITLESYLSGMFHGKEWDGETPAWLLVPEAQSRISADSLGFGHLYPPKEQ